MIQIPVLHTFKRVADFLAVGEGEWYEALPDGALMFHDGPGDPKSRGSPKLSHFRYYLSHLAFESDLTYGIF
jgi:hypothetical protein